MKRGRKIKATSNPKDRGRKAQQRAKIEKELDRLNLERYVTKGAPFRDVAVAAMRSACRRFLEQSYSKDEARYCLDLERFWGVKFTRSRDK